MDSPIQQLVPPVVIISACGLLCLAQFARYTSIIGRVREMHRQRLDALNRLATLDGPKRQRLADRCDELESQAHQVLKLVGLIRYALLFLVSSVMLMIVSSLMIGLEFVWPDVGRVGAVAAFVAGLLCMLTGMTFVFREVRLSLRVVLAEHARLETVGDALTHPAHDHPTEDS